MHPDSTPDYKTAGVREDNLLLKVWWHPQATLRYILTYCPDKFMLSLLALGGVVRALSRAERTYLGDHLSGAGVWAAALLVGSLSGLFTYFFYSWGLELSGRLLGGRTNAARFRTVIAWSLVPTVGTLLTTGLAYCVVGDDLFRHTGDHAASNDSLLLELLGVLDLVLSGWAVVILVRGIMLVQQFRVGRSILHMLLPGVLLLALVAAGVLLFKLLAATTT